MAADTNFVQKSRKLRDMGSMLPFPLAKTNPAPAHQARPLFEIYHVYFFDDLDCITHMNFIVINMLCLIFSILPL